MVQLFVTVLTKGHNALKTYTFHVEFHNIFVQDDHVSDLT